MTIDQAIAEILSNMNAETDSDGDKVYSGVKLTDDPYEKVPSPVKLVLVDPDNTNPILSAKNLVYKYEHKVTISVIVSAQNKTRAVYKADLQALLALVIASIEKMIKNPAYSNIWVLQMGMITFDDVTVGAEKCTGAILPLTIQTRI